MKTKRSKFHEFISCIRNIFLERSKEQIQSTAHTIGGKSVQYPITDVYIKEPIDLFRILDIEMYPWNIGNQWLFRGQNDDSPLIPFAERQGIRPNNCTLHELRTWEANLFDSFLKKSAYMNILPGYSFPAGLILDSDKTHLRDTFEMDILNDIIPETWISKNLPLLGLAQHFGLPTSLMDWTTNRYKALLFANSVRKKTREYKTNSCVLWALNLDLWRRLSPARPCTKTLY